MSDLHRGRDARAIVLKLQILSGAVEQECCFRGRGNRRCIWRLRVHGHRTHVGHSTSIAVVSVTVVCAPSARLLAVRLQEPPTTFVPSSTLTVAPASVLPLEKPQSLSILRS